MLRSALFVLAWIGLLTGTSMVSAQEVPGCGSLRNAFGPFDYRDTANHDQLEIVEKYHFTATVQSLTGGSTGSVAQDLDYTLRAFPNHHSALDAIAKYALRGGKFQGMTIPTAECYFQRATAFQPDDAVVRVLYGNYLFKSGQSQPAKEQYEKALALAPASKEIAYNSGLFFVAVGDLARAKSLAQFAYQDGYPLPGLKLKIEQAEAANKSH